MKLKNPILQKLFAGLWYSFAAMLVLAALLLTAARVLLPYVESYRQEIQDVVSERTGQPVRIGEMQAEWRGFTPYLVFSNIDLLDKNAEKPVLHFSSASVGIHIWRSLYSQVAVVSNLTVAGLNLNLTRRKTGEIEIIGLSNRDKENTGEDSAAIARWLFSQPDIGIEDSQVTWTDKLNEHDTLTFTKVRLRLRNDKERHQLEGDIVLPKHYGKSLGFALDVKGDMLRPHDWNGSLYVKGVALQTRDLAGVLTISNLSLRSASVDVEAWSEWSKSKLINLQGRLTADDLSLSLGKDDSKLKKISLAMNWLREDKGWKLQVSEIDVTTDRRWPRSNFVVNKNREQRQYDIQLSFMDLGDVMPVIAASGVTDAFTKQLQEMNLTGDVHDIHLRFSRSGEFSAAARLQDVAYKPWQSIPGVENLDAEISGSANEGNFKIKSKNLVLNAPEVFNNALGFDEFTAAATWTRDEAGYHINVESFDMESADVSLNGRMLMDLGGKEGPVIDLAANLKGQNAGNTARYLPAKVMNKDAVNWISRSIKEGSVPGGNVVFKGPLLKFPFHKKEGTFKVGFDVIDGVLDYEPGWPMIHGVEAHVAFDGPTMQITSNKGTIYDTSLHDVVVRIPDVEADIPVVSFEGTSKGTSADALKFVLATGISGKREKGLEQLEVSGDTTIKLAMDIPIEETIENTYSGSFSFENSAVSLKGNKHKLTSVNGAVSFENTNFHSRDIKASLFGNPLTIDVDSHIKANLNMPEAAVRVRARGVMDLNKLLRDKLNRNIPAFISGEDRWQITLRIPDDPDDETHWSVSSRLLDSTVALPAPLIKPKGEARFLKLAGTLPDDKLMNLWLQYGTILNGVVSINTQEHFLPVTGELHFGEVPATLPVKKGVVVRGNINELSIDAWQNWLEAGAETGDKPLNKSKEFFPVRDINLVFAKISFNQHVLNNVHINGSKGQDKWLLELESDRITGKVSLPIVKSQQPVRLDLVKLKLPRTSENSPKGLGDPRKLPALEMSVEEFYYDDLHYGELELALEPQLQGSFIKTLRLDSKEMNISASGDWQVNDLLEHTTRLSARLNSDDLGKLLKKFDYAEAVTGGRTKVNAQLQWKGSPADFDLSNIVGTMGIAVRKGQLLDIEPGAGRVFGLLSLATLPRRLTLDFSDLFNKGFSFDVIKGNFTFDNGDAYTSDLYLDGPAARIDTSGRIGMKNEDYDQLVTVTPKLTASLPVAGALVGGPVAGGVLFAVEKLFGRSIDQISQFQYTMTGSWDNPVIEKLKVEAEQPASAVVTE